MEPDGRNIELDRNDTEMRPERVAQPVEWRPVIRYGVERGVKGLGPRER